MVAEKADEDEVDMTDMDEGDEVVEDTTELVCCC